jgi:hypothetical protein
MKRTSFFLVWILLFSLNSQAAEPEFYKLKITSNAWTFTNRDSFLEGKVTKKILAQLDSIYKKTPSTYDFFYKKSTDEVKVFIHCSFDFYAIIDGQLIKEYQFANRGYTCGSHLLERNNTFHILGGGGLWNTHSDLMKFDSLEGSWEFIQAKNQPLDYFPTGAYQTKKGIVNLFGEYTNPRIPRLEKESNGYFLDLEKKSWQPIKIDIKEFNLAEIVHTNESRLYESQDYGFSVTNSKLPSLGWILWILFEKETGNLFFYEGNTNNEMLESPFIEIIGNKIRYFDYNEGSAIDGKEVLIDLDLIRSKTRAIGQLQVLESPKENEGQNISSILVWLGLPLLLFFTGWIGIQIQKRKTVNTQPPLEVNVEGEQEVEEESEDLLGKLLAYDGEKLSTEVFDTLLGIHQITNFDSKRIKRSRLFKEINGIYLEKKGFPLITRIKNPEDKRFVFYKITF